VRRKIELKYSFHCYIVIVITDHLSCYKRSPDFRDQFVQSLVRHYTTCL